MPIRSIIIDDEPPARRYLRELLGAHPQIEIVAEADNSATGLVAIREQRPDLVFLDVQMPGGSGFELLEQLEDAPRIIFVTAFDEYAVRAFEVNAMDYLLKPISPERLARSISRIQTPEDSTPAPRCYAYSDRILIKSEGRMRMVRVAEIVYVRAEENFSHLVTEGHPSCMLYRSLAQWKSLLPDEDFWALDRSLLLNRHRVRQLEGQARYGLHVHLQGIAAPLALGRAASTRLIRLLKSHQ